MMTLEEMEKALAESLPVVIHNPDTDGAWFTKMVGIIELISPNPTEASTFQEPACWILLPSYPSVFVWAHEIRLAKLRSPLVFNRQFIHTSSTKYSGNDMSQHARRKGAVASARDNEPF